MEVHHFHKHILQVLVDQEVVEMVLPIQVEQEHQEQLTQVVEVEEQIILGQMQVELAEVE